MRRANNKEQFTPFGLWLQEYVRTDLSITNLDYVVEDYKNKRIQLVEEKQCGGVVHRAQLLTFNVMDAIFDRAAKAHGYDYWGFFVLRMPSGATMPGPGMTLNDKVITCEQLAAHLDFQEKFCEPLQMPWRTRKAA